MASIFGPNDNVKAVFASLQAVLGPGEIVQYHVGGDAEYRLVGLHRQRTVVAEVHTDGGVLHSVRFAVDLGGLPITLLLNHRRNTTIYAVPEVRTGDADFDQVFLLNGFPAEVLREALDAPTRQWLLATYREKTPTLETEHGSLRVGVVLRASQGVWMLPSGREMPPAEIAYWLDALLSITDRLTGSFRRQADTIARTHGASAAEQWVRQHTEAMTARASRRGNLRVLLFAVFVGIPLLGTLATLAVVFLLMWLG